MRIVINMLPPKLYCKIGIIFFLFLSCTKPSQQGGVTIPGPKSAIAKGYFVPHDRVPEPKVVVAGVPEEMPIKKRIVPVTIFNKRIPGNPKIIPVSNLQKITPGKDGVPLPKTVPAISKPFIPGVPEVVKAKDAFVKDQNPASFSSFNKLQGLMHHTIFSVMQDRRGNMWFGTGEGVSRYDGKTFTHYTKKEGLYSRAIISIVEDRNGNLWFCGSDGVTKYDGKYFTNYTEKEGLSDKNVNCCIEDNEGNLWFGTHDYGVNKFDGKTFTHYTDKEGLGDNRVISVTKIKNGSLWFCTEGGPSEFNGKNFTTIKKDFGDNVIYAMQQDKNGFLWFVSIDGGVYKYDGKTLAQYTQNEGLNHNDVLNVLADKKGDLWFCTFGYGVTKYDGKTFTHYTEKEGLSSNFVMSAYEDRSGNLWFGTYNSGVNLYHGRTFTHIASSEGLVDNILNTIVEGKNGTLWFSASTGQIYSYDAHLTSSSGTNRDGREKSFVYMDGIEKQTYNLFESLCDNKGNLWFATYHAGLLKYDGKKLVRYTTRQGLSSDEPVSMTQDKQGNLWFGFLNGDLNKFDGKTFTHYRSKPGFHDGRIRVVKGDNEGNIWFGEKGLYRFDGKNFVYFGEKEGFSNNTIFSILPDKKGNIWFGTSDAGLIKYNGETFVKYTEKEGLSSNSILSILEDKKGNIWFGGRVGISELKGENLKNESAGYPLTFKNYTYEDGFFGVGCRGAICETDDGNIWIGTNDRLTIYHPEGEIVDSTAPNIQLTDVGLYDENVRWPNLLKKDTSFILGNGIVLQDFRFDGLTAWYGLPENLSLAYDNNYLDFNFIGITQKQPHKVKYQYKLEGQDKNWSTVSSRTDVSYSDLDHGTYTFKVRAVNGEGYWSNDFNYTFTIRPPFWNTWWFRALLVLLGLGLVFGYVRLRTRQLRQQEKKLERIVEERTTELEERTVELEQSNSDKDRIMKILVHDLRNPLSGIQRLSSMMLDQTGLTVKNMEMLDLIHNSSMSLSEMIDDLIEATLKNHKESVKPKETDMQLLVDQSANALSFKANEKKQEIILNADEQLFSMVDFQKIQRVLSNLISNSIKFSPSGSAITVRLVKNNGSVQISVEDQGIGIPDELKDKVFDMFTRAKRHGTAGEEPFGLGLSICKQIVEAHNGKIWFESQSGKGTKFYLEFPLLQN
jgi:signal transduction histidine kinase/ligand-binding sensor domain-containing protein